MEATSMWWCWDPEAVQETISAIAEQLTEALNQLFAGLDKLVDAISAALISKEKQAMVIPARSKRFSLVRCIGRPCRGYPSIPERHARSII